MVPRLVLGLVAAASSLLWCALVLDVADAVSGFIAVSLDVTPGDLLRAPLNTFLTAVQAGSVGMAQVLALLYLVYGFFVLYVIVQMVLRLALIDWPRLRWGCGFCPTRRDGDATGCASS